MKSDIFVGHHCPKCKFTSSTFITLGADGCCPGCGESLQVGRNGPTTKTVANFQCKHCGVKAALFSTVAVTACPHCGQA